MSEIKIQLEYINRQLLNLIALCNQHKETETLVSDEARNTTQVVITLLNRLLDQVIFNYFDNKIRSQLTLQDFEGKKHKVQFPVCKNLQELRSLVGQFGMNDLKGRDLAAFKIIEEAQPYHPENAWISLLRKYSNLGHRKLLAQSRRQDATVFLGQALRLTLHSGTTTMRNVDDNGNSFNHFYLTNKGIEGEIDTNLKPRVEIKVSFFLEGENVDVLALCRNSTEGIERIIGKFEQVT